MAEGGAGTPGSPSLGSPQLVELPGINTPFGLSGTCVVAGPEGAAAVSHAGHRCAVSALPGGSAQPGAPPMIGGDK